MQLDWLTRVHCEAVMLAPTLSYKRNQETRFVLLCCYNALGKCCENTREVCKNTITE